MLDSILLFLNIGGGEMVLIILAALLMFGGKKLPELARGLGRGLREFKDASESIKRDINDQINNFGKELDVSEPVNNKPADSLPVSQTASATEDYSDGGKREPEYQASDSKLDDPTETVEPSEDAEKKS